MRLWLPEKATARLSIKGLLGAGRISLRDTSALSCWVGQEGEEATLRFAIDLDALFRDTIKGNRGARVTRGDRICIYTVDDKFFSSALRRLFTTCNTDRFSGRGWIPRAALRISVAGVPSCRRVIMIDLTF